MGAVDDLERPVVLAPLAGDEEDVDLAALQRPDGVVDAVGDPDELEVRVVGQGPLHVEGVQPFDGDECADESVAMVRYFACLFRLAWSRSVFIDTVSGGVFLAPTCGRRRNQSVPVSDASASFCASGAAALRTYVVDWPGTGARRITTSGARSVRSVVPRRETDVDVDAVALADVADEAARPRRSGSRRRAAPRSGCVGRASVVGDAEVGRRDLLAGEDVPDGDAAVEVRRVGDRADLEVVLRERRGLEELLLRR